MTAIAPPFRRKLEVDPLQVDRLLNARLQAQVDRLTRQVLWQQDEIAILTRRLDAATEKQILLLNRLIDKDATDGTQGQVHGRR